MAWDRRWFLASTTFTFVALPWYVWVGAETKGQFLFGFFLDHNINRAIAPMESHGGFPGYYLVILLGSTVPWSIFLLAAWWFGFWSAVRQPWRRFATCWLHAAEPTGDPTMGTSVSRDRTSAYRLLVCWIIVYCVFFSVARTKLPNYVLPVIVPCAIMMARFLQRWRTGHLLLPNWLVLAGVMGLVLVGVVIAVGAAVVGDAFEWSILRGRAIPGIAPWAWMGLIPLAAAVLGWWFLRQRQINRYIVTIAITAVVLLAPLAVYGSMFFNDFKAPRLLVEQAGVCNRNEDIRIGCWRMEHLPSLNFYLQRSVTYIEKEKNLAPFLQQPMRSFLFIPANDWQRLQPSLAGCGHVVARQHDIYHHVDILVVTNR